MKKILFIVIFLISCAALSAQTGTGWTNMRAKYNFRDSININNGWKIGTVIITSTGAQFNYLSIATGTTGTGNLVFSTSPVFTTPNIGTATGSITGNAATVTGFTPASGSLTLSGADAITLTTTNTTSLTLPTTGTLATTSEVASKVNIADSTGISPGNYLSRLQGANLINDSLDARIGDGVDIGDIAVLHTDTTALLAPYSKKKLITANLTAGVEADVTLTGVTSEPYAIWILDENGVNITEAVKDSTAISSGTYHTYIYSVDSKSNIKVKVLW